MCGHFLRRDVGWYGDLLGPERNLATQTHELPLTASVKHTPERLMGNLTCSGNSSPTRHMMREVFPTLATEKPRTETYFISINLKYQQLHRDHKRFCCGFFGKSAWVLVLLVRFNPSWVLILHVMCWGKSILYFRSVLLLISKLRKHTPRQLVTHRCSPWA